MARRGNGEGTIAQRKDGRWEGRAYVLLPDGRRKRKTVYGKTRADVADSLAEILDQVRRGVVTPTGNITVASYLESWLEDVVRRKVRPRTFENYHGVVHNHLVPEIGRRRLDRLTTTDVRRMINRKADSGLAPATVKKLHVVLGSALQHAVRDDLVARNVARLVEVSVPQSASVKPLTVNEAKQLLRAATGDRLYALWAVAIGIGLRRGESLGLRWDDIDLAAGTIRVEQTLQRSKGKGLVFGPTKTVRSKRTVPLPAPSLQALRIHKARQDAERKTASSLWKEHGLVFTSQLGTPLEPRNVNRSFHALTERAEVGGYWVEVPPADSEDEPGRVWVRELRLHDLRHTCATLLLAQGVHPRVVMEILGHSQIGVTMNTYTHVPSEVMRSAMTGLGDLLDPSGKGQRETPGLSSDMGVTDGQNEDRDPEKGP
jgi:integrase